jgi:hypothetical protein
MLQQVRFTISIVARRFRSRAVLELENLALRHQLHVLRRQRPEACGRFTACVEDLRLKSNWASRMGLNGVALAHSVALACNPEPHHR